jgi:hypothetical protein
MLHWLDSQGYIIRSFVEYPPHYLDVTHPKVSALGVYATVTGQHGMVYPRYNFQTQSWEELHSPPEIPVEQKIAEAWQAANDFVNSQMDLNSRHSINLLLSSPTTTQAQIDRILAYSQWWAGVWTHYATVKAQLLAGMSVSFDPQVVGNCPYSIWEIWNPE